MSQSTIPLSDTGKCPQCGYRMSVPGEACPRCAVLAKEGNGVGSTSSLTRFSLAPSRVQDYSTPATPTESPRVVVAHDAVETAPTPAQPAERFRLAPSRVQNDSTPATPTVSPHIPPANAAVENGATSAQPSGHFTLAPSRVQAQPATEAAYVDQPVPILPVPPPASQAQPPAPQQARAAPARKANSYLQFDCQAGTVNYGHHHRRADGDDRMFEFRLPFPRGDMAGRSR